MKRVAAVLMIMTMLALPVSFVGPKSAVAADTITIVTKERGSDRPALYACYAVADVTGGGGVGKNCDGDDGIADGTTVVTVGPCAPCRVTQSLPDQPDGPPTNGRPTIYLLEPAQVGSSDQTYTFNNFLKPYIVVTFRNAKTGKLVKGGCLRVSNPNVPGSAIAACDGNANGGDADQDGRKNGKITAKRLPTPDGKPATITYKVENSTAGRKAKAVMVTAEPAETGEVEKATLKLRSTR